jgi:hypothetical protein
MYTYTPETIRESGADTYTTASTKITTIYTPITSRAPAERARRKTV